MSRTVRVMPPITTVFILLVVVVAGSFGQGTPTDTGSTVAPEDIFSLSEEDFQLWISGRQPKAWGSRDNPDTNSIGTTSTSTTSTETTTTTTPPRSTLPSVFRTSSTTPNPLEVTSTTTTNPLDLFTIRPAEPIGSDVKSWIEDENDSTVQPDVLGDQFKPAGEDFNQWLERQMNKVQEVTFTPQTTLTGDHPFPGLVTRLTTNRNRIPSPTTFAPSSAGSVVVTLPPPVTTNVPFPDAPQLPTATFEVTRGEQPVIDLQKWLRDQLQLSQSLTDRLLAQWSPSGGSFVRSDGHTYHPSAVSYQTSALIHGVQGISHSSQVRTGGENSPALPFPGTSHSTDSYLSHQHKPTIVNTTPANGQPSPAPVFYPAGSFYYSHPSVSHYGAFVSGYRAPVVINYH